MVPTLGSRIFGSFASPILLGPLAILATIASLFSAFKYVEVRSERNAARAVVQILTRWGDQTCEAVGEVFRPQDAKDPTTLEKDPEKWGGACRVRIRGLVRFEADTKAASAQAALEAIAEQERKMAADQAAARKARARLRLARRNMEAVDAQVQNDEVDGRWFAGLNDLAGLRPPAGRALETDRPGGAGEGDAAGGPDGVS